MFLGLLLVYGLLRNLNLRLPASLERRSIANVVLTRRHQDTGSRLRALTPELLFDTSSRSRIMYEAIAVYAVVWSTDERAASITHRPSGQEVTLPQHAHITPKFKFENMWHDLDACAVLAPARYKLCDIFLSPGTGPHAFAWLSGASKPFQSLCQELTEQHGQQEAA